MGPARPVRKLERDGAPPPRAAAAGPTTGHDRRRL